jgi:hypothetical protein
MTVHGCVRQCGSVRGRVRFSGSAAVCGSLRGWMCVAVHMAGGGSARGSVWQCARQCMCGCPAVRARQCAAD